MNSTLQYYRENSAEFASQTQNIDFSEIRKQFTSLLLPKSLILDLGCGAGRDTKAFLQDGFRVEALDGCQELCHIASKYSGIHVECMTFSELNEQEKYDGIWACASILHLPKHELIDVFKRIINSLKQNGILYTSFKYGNFSGMRNGRYFIDFDEDTFDEFMSLFPQLAVIKYSVTNDVRANRENERWLNILIQKI